MTPRALPQSPNAPDDSGAYARAVLDIAAEVEAAETRIKAEILKAAAAGDCPRVTDIVTRWMNGPATEVLGDARH